MTQYPEEFKSSMIAKMLPPNNVSVPQLARETGIPKETLYTWRSKHRKVGGAPTAPGSISGDLSGEEKFAIVIQSASLNEVELSEYCRRKGLYPEQISVWRASCMEANASQAPKIDRTKLKAQSKHIKRLEGELRRKEKALAELAALLVLQKKSRKIWGEPEDEISNWGRDGK